MVFWSAGGGFGTVKGEQHHSLVIQPSSPTKFPEISLDDFSEYLMFVSMIFIRALFFCLVPFTKLDEGFTELSTDRGVFDQLS